MATYTCPDGHSSTADDYCDVCGAPIASTGAPAAASGGQASSLDLGAPASGSVAGAVLGSATPAPAGRVCSNCSSTNLADALFCEDCGFDFTTGQLPQPLAPPIGASATAAPLDPPPLDPPTAGDVALDSSVAVQPPPSDPAAPVVPPSAQPITEVEWVVEAWIDPDWHAAQDVDDPCPSPGMPIVTPLRARNVLVGRTSATRNIHPDVDLNADTGVSRRHAQLTTDGLRWWVEDLQSANGTYVGTAGEPLPEDPITPGTRVELPDDGRVYLGAWTRLVLRKASAAERASVGAI